MLKKRRLSYLIISASVLLLLAAAYFINARKPSESVNYTKTAMGTVVELTLMKGGQARFDEAAKVGLAKKGMALNLGGVAKGYIVDMAAGVLKAHGVKSAVVHAGGDMFVFQEDRTDPFTIGIQHPRKKGELLGEAHVYNGAVPTSGDYERYFEKDGVRYHHILDPKTGFPAKGTQSVTIIAEDPTSADALSTAVFVMGPEKGMELIERLEGVEGVFVHENGKVRTSSGFEGKIY